MGSRSCGGWDERGIRDLGGERRVMMKWRGERLGGPREGE